MRSYRYLHYDVFTDHLFGGNQLAVFPDGRGLPPAVMQAIAQEMNFSETTFVLPVESDAADVRVRIFTPGEELPIAGHPTIGTAFALARTGMLAAPRSSVVFGLGVGPIDVALTWKGADLGFAWMTQLVPTLGAPAERRDSIAAALRLTERDLVEALPVQVVSCGVPYVLVPLRTRTAVDAASFDAAAYEAFRDDLALPSTVCVYLFTTEAGDDDRATAYCRMFGAGLGIAEDPATGSAAGPLGCYLVHHGLVSGPAAGTMLCRQGVKMGRPSDIHVAIDANDDAIVRVRVGGTAVLAGEATLYVP